MKHLLFSALVLCALTAHAQLKKGNLVGIHTVTVMLDPNVTMNQFTDYVLKTVLPEYERVFTGSKLYFAKSVRGEQKKSVGWIFVFESEEARAKYYNDDGTPTETGKAANAKFQATFDKLSKLGETSSTYTDWVVQ